MYNVTTIRQKINQLCAKLAISSTLHTDHSESDTQIYSMDTVSMGKERNRWVSYHAVNKISKILLKVSLLTGVEAVSSPDYKVAS